MAKTLTSEELSRNFRLYEFLRSDTADKLGATEQYNPPAIVLQNLKHLAGELQIVRDLYGKAMPVTSGYRCPVVNKAVG
ncbi:MAG: peptidase M15, partial [Prevotellaceae bacterium]|nr:peptidase M15 [Prevotellaceae bacterium]